jgi:hypothetical protein
MRVLVNRERQVGAVRRRACLVGEELLFRGERKRAQIVKRTDRTIGKARTLEGVRLAREPNQLIKARELGLSSPLVDRQSVGPFCCCERRSAL